MCPSSDYGHATHLLEADDAISSDLMFILSDCGFGVGVSFLCWLLVVVVLCVECWFGSVGVLWW